MSWLALGLIPNYAPTGDPPDSFDLGHQVQLAISPAELARCAGSPLSEEQLQWLVPRFSHVLLCPYDLEVDPGPIFTPAQREVSDRLMLANLAVWLANVRTDLHFRYMVHIRVNEGTVQLRHLRPVEPLYTGRYAEPTRPQHLQDARALNEAIGGLRREGPLWTAIRALWGALAQTWFHNRYALLWTGLEALFGPQEGDAVTFRVSQNLAFFLGTTVDERERLFRAAKRAYSARSKVVHGEYEGVRYEDHEALVHEAEGWLQRAILLILRTPEYIEIFREPRRRDALMERLVLGLGAA